LIILFEDEHLLVINKPAGMNTHAPSPYAGEGIYDWLRHREPRWANLAIIHRLDKQTSGVMVFGKTSAANRSLTEQFAEHKAEKIYLLATDRPIKKQAFTARSALVRTGDKYLSRPVHAGADVAETRFKFLRGENERNFVEARPITGRTHQIRVHAAEHGFPIVGDDVYGGSPAARLWLHAAELSLQHPGTGQRTIFRAPANFQADVGFALREAVIDRAQTNAYRLVHGASDQHPGWYVDRLDKFLLSQSEQELTAQQREQLAKLMVLTEARGVYHKRLTRHVRQTKLDDVSPQPVLGQWASGPFFVRENRVQYELNFDEGYSVGLFLDQRDNRRRLLVKHVAAGFPFLSAPGEWEVLNTFAYTCGFSVCAALSGARTTSLDLSKKYLEWGKRNFALNALDPARHDFIYGDAFDWMARMAKKQRRFNAILLDPPTFSQSKQSGVFRVEKDYASLVKLALPLLKNGGTLLASTNSASWPADQFVRLITSTIAKTKHRVLQMHYVPQPPDFPVSRAEPAYLKTIWLRID